ncbi:hypothetical protein HOC37_00680 [bacterium]|jgi:hypothetical protein|nr:hypothetical protein [bacterium]MBT3581009.1 hypothetical protein [bacterium]MBT4551480.1 hypothetical protein [bacterium]MBT5988853.1 hypothetical protein [bacterium]MBT7088286.1 hypothetical protein [bacterium]
MKKIVAISTITSSVVSELLRIFRQQAADMDTEAQLILERNVLGAEGLSHQEKFNEIARQIRDEGQDDFINWGISLLLFFSNNTNLVTLPAFMINVNLNQLTAREPGANCRLINPDSDPPYLVRQDFVHIFVPDKNNRYFIFSIHKFEGSFYLSVLLNKPKRLPMKLPIEEPLMVGRNGQCFYLCSVRDDEVIASEKVFSFKLREEANGSLIEIGIDGTEERLCKEKDLSLVRLQGAE